MEFKRLDKRKGSGAASIRSRYAYLIHLPDIEYFPPTNDKGVRLEGDIVLQEGRTMIPVYLTNPSQEYSYDTPGNDDEKTFLVKFVGTHPGTELEALEFSKNLLEEPFLVLIPGCEKNAPGKLLGQPNNPLIFTSTHKASKDGDKFNFNFEQRVGSEYIYFSYGGIINLPPSPDGPPSEPGANNGFDPTKWARIDASNIDEHIAAWRAKLNIQQTEDRVLTIGTITATTTTLNLALHASGVNSVLMSGVVRSKTEDDDFTFAPVSAGKLKYVLLYSLPDTQLFHIVEGAEGNEASYPDLPPGALLIKAVLISEFGALLEDADGGYKPLAEDPWRNIVINNNAAINVVMASSPSCSFNVLVGAGSTAPKIAGIRTKVKKNTRDGQEITFYNDSDTPVALLPGDYEETLVYTTFPFEEAYEIKPRSFAKFKRKNNKYKELPAGGGKASEVENDSTVAGSNVKLALEHVQAEIDAEVVERAAQDLIEKNARIAADNAEALARANAITTETNARIAADKIETVVIALSPYNEDLLDNTSRLGLGVLSFPLKVLSFQTSAFPVPTGSGITTDLRKNGTSVATSVISAGASNSTGNAPPTFSADTFAIGDRLNFFTPTGGVGSTVKGQNLVATLIIERL